MMIPCILAVVGSSFTLLSMLMLRRDANRMIASLRDENAALVKRNVELTRLLMPAEGEGPYRTPERLASAELPWSEVREELAVRAIASIDPTSQAETLLTRAAAKALLAEDVDGACRTVLLGISALAPETPTEARLVSIARNTLGLPQAIAR
jgi:hypothetical protein